MQENEDGDASQQNVFSQQEVFSFKVSTTGNCNKIIKITW